MFTDLSLRKKLTFGFGLTILCAIVVGLVGWSGIRKLGTALDHGNLATSLLENANKAQLCSTESINSTDSFVLTGNEEYDKISTGKNTETISAITAAQEIANKIDNSDLSSAIAKVAELAGTAQNADTALSDQIRAVWKMESKQSTAQNTVEQGFSDYLRNTKSQLERGNISDDSNNSTVALFKQRVNILEAFGAFQKVSGQVRNIVIERNPQKATAIQSSINSEIGKIISLVGAEAQNSTVSTSGSSNLGSLNSKIADWEKNLDEYLAGYVRQCELQSTQAAAFKNAVEQEAVLAEQIKHYIGVEVSAATKETTFTLTMISFTLFAAVLVGVVLGCWLVTEISHNIRKIITYLQKLAEQGDFRENVDRQLTGRGDEIGVLSQATDAVISDYRNVAKAAEILADGDWNFTVPIKGDVDFMSININKMLSQVTAVLRQVNEAVEHVSTGALQVQNSSDGLANGATQSAAALEEISATMNEMGDQTSKNAQSATDADKLAQLTNTTAISGQEMMTKMVESMQSITKNANDVQKVIKVIDDISFQTNLLALNAAVEAARAGVHGKGFAVVAEEVRNLAARSAKAAGETTQMISHNNRQIQDGADIVEQTAEMLKEILNHSEQTASLIKEIALASTNQAQGVAQVSQALQQIDSVTQQNTAQAEQTASVSREMNTHTQNLKEQLTHFRLAKVSSGSSAATNYKSPTEAKPVASVPGRPEPVISLGSSISSPVHAATKIPAVPSKSVIGTLTKTKSITKPGGVAPAAVPKPRTNGNGKQTIRFNAAKGAVGATSQTTNTADAVKAPAATENHPSTSMPASGWGGVPDNKSAEITIHLDDKEFGKY